MPEYLLDANVFIEAKNSYYGFDIFPVFWTWLDEQNDAGYVATVEPVVQELIAGNDRLADWMEERKNGPWSLPVDDEETQIVYGQIARWVAGGDYFTAARDDFLDAADPLLIAKAKVIDATVVTHEDDRPEAKKSVPIPTVCKAFDVRVANTFDLMRKLNASFS